jgi:hypothetical protein
VGSAYASSGAESLPPTVLQERYDNQMRLYLGRPEREDLTLNLWIEAIEEERAKKAG